MMQVQNDQDSGNRTWKIQSHRQIEVWEVNKMFRNRILMKVKAYQIYTIILHTQRRLLATMSGSTRIRREDTNILAKTNC